MTNEDLQVFAQNLRYQAKETPLSFPEARIVLKAIAESIDAVITARKLAEIMNEPSNDPGGHR